MEYVCNESDGTSPWHYDAEKKMYHRTFADGKPYGKILGDHLPNPDILWAKRNEIVRKAIGTLAPEVRERNKPSKTTWALWEHWMGKNK